MFGGGGSTVNDEKGSESAPKLVTTTVRAPKAASGVIVIVTGRLVAVPPPAAAAVTPVPLKATVAPERFVPVIFAGKLVPMFPLLGVIAVIVGFGPVTRKPLKDSDEPPGVS